LTTVKPASATPELKSGPFLDLVRKGLFSRLGREPQFRLRHSMLQVYFQDPRQHYEVWLRNSAGLVEIGLHFEGEKDDNLARLNAIAEAMPEIAPALGTPVDLEQWTESWTRLHETVPLKPLDQRFAAALADRVFAYIEALEPVVENLEPMPPRRDRPQNERGRWRRGKRA
jgi:hypothetical protein